VKKSSNKKIINAKYTPSFPKALKMRGILHNLHQRGGDLEEGEILLFRGELKTVP